MHILLIEDNPGYAEALSSVLRQKIDHIESLHFADSVSGSMEMIETQHPLDLVITDTQIKGGSCIDVLSNVLQTEYLVIFMSTMDERDPRIRWMAESGFSFYSKNEELSVLIDLISTGGDGSQTANNIDKLRNLTSPVQHKPEPVKKKPWCRLFGGFL